MLSIVIPYYEGAAVFLHCLRALAEQVFAGSWEVIVVNDGSTVPAIEYRWPRPDVPLKFLTLDRQRGQSAATNAGIQAAQGEYILLFAQDMIAVPDLLAAHLQAHRQTSGDWAILGAMPFAPGISDSDFYDFLLTGPQFAFKQFRNGEYVDAIADGQALPPAQYFYAPNVSLQRRLLLDAGLFDESLPYGGQDLELGYRLQQRGLRLQYRAAACAYHDHRYTLETFCQKQERLGRAMQTLYTKAPALRNTAISEVYLALQPRPATLTALLQMIRDLDAQRPFCPAQDLFADIPLPLLQAVRRIWQKIPSGVNGKRCDQIPGPLRRSLRYLLYKIAVSYFLGKGFMAAVGSTPAPLPPQGIPR